MFVEATGSLDMQRDQFGKYLKSLPRAMPQQKRLFRGLHELELREVTSGVVFFLGTIPTFKNWDFPGGLPPSRLLARADERAGGHGSRFLMFFDF